MAGEGITSNGFFSMNFEELREEIDAYQKANISEGLDLTDDSIDGVENASNCRQLAKLWEHLEILISNLNPDDAEGWILEQIAAISGTKKTKWTKTRVLATVNLDALVTLPVGSIANLTARPNVRFKTVEEVTAGASGGNYEIEFIAVDDGEIRVDVGELSEINVAVSGWNSVYNNAEEFYTGTEPEDDPDFRAKRERELASTGSSTLDAIIAAVSLVSGVTDVVGYENPYPTPQGIMPPHSMWLIVRGGLDADVAQAIYDSRAGGRAGLVGDEVVTINDSQNRPHDIRFDRPEELSLYISYTVTTEDGWGGTDSVAEIKAAAKAYIDSLRTGHDIIHGKLESAGQDVSGVYDVTALTIGFVDPPVETGNLTVDTLQYVSVDEDDIDVAASAHAGDL